MGFWAAIVSFFDSDMTTPTAYGWFHILWILLSFLVGILLCVTHKRGDTRRVRIVVLIAAITVIVLEVYKQIIFTLEVTSGVVSADYQWYAFPWQFCSTPMYVGLLTAVFRRGRVHHALMSYLATYALFAGLCVMVYPGDVFIETIGINIQTMVCHGSMITVGIYLWGSGYVKFHWKTLVGALSVFASLVGVAVVLNELFYHTGIVGEETFNMFYISHHFPPHLPVYSSVQEALPYPLDLLVYILGFSLFAMIITLAAWGIKSAATAIRAHARRT